jgi:hypothetical protein
VIAVALLPVSIATVAEGSAVIGLQFDRLVEILNGPVVLALFKVRDASVVEGFGVARIEPDRFVVVGECTLGIILVCTLNASIDVENGEKVATEFARTDGLPQAAIASSPPSPAAAGDTARRPANPAITIAPSVGLETNTIASPQADIPQACPALRPNADCWR